MEVVLFAEHIELLLHLDHQLILQLLQLHLQLAPLLLVLPPQGIPLRLSVLLHQFVHSLLLTHLQLAQLFAKVQGLVDPFFQGHQLFLELKLFQSIFGLNKKIL